MKTEEVEILQAKIPHLLKYMGSKREIIDFVSNSIKGIDVNSQWVCDLFSGTGIVSASLKSCYNIHANDIQAYSAILSNTYLSNLKGAIRVDKIEDIKVQASNLVYQFEKKYPQLIFDYSNAITLHQFLELEQQQQLLIDKNFDIGFHLFAKNYSGTYWSYNQCVWIDSLRAVAERYKGKPEYFAILSSLIFAMSYVSQSTGHYAQFREATESNMLDILAYRKKDIWTYFERKFKELLVNLNGSASKNYLVTTLDYLDCLRIIEQGSIVYADPPYQSVHYSRFYHALETLVKYDYPTILYKGRYREDRHQSPFCKKTTVKQAFASLFLGVKEKNAHMALSYSDTGMISLQQILKIAGECFKEEYAVTVLEKDHVHSNMGRSEEKEQNVTEYIILFKKKNERKSRSNKA